MIKDSFRLEGHIITSRGSDPYKTIQQMIDFCNTHFDGCHVLIQTIDISGGIEKNE